MEVWHIFVVLVLFASEALARSGRVKRAIVYSCSGQNTLFDKKCYKYFNTPIPFGQAESVCNVFKGHIASVHDTAKNDFLKGYMVTHNTDIWIGLSDQTTEGDWKWTDATPFDYLKWGQRNGVQHPQTNTNENCVQMSRSTTPSGGWLHTVCDQQASWAPTVCEIPAIETEVTTTTTTTTTQAAAAPTPAPTPTSNRVCHGEWYQYGDKCYRITKGMKKWEKAWKFCEKLGAKIASIDSDGLQKFLEGKFMGPYAHGLWIGLNSEDANGVWKWKADGGAISYQNWAFINGQQQPENLVTKRCVQTENWSRQQMGKWNDVICTSKAWSLCEKLGKLVL